MRYRAIRIEDMLKNEAYLEENFDAFHTREYSPMPYSLWGMGASLICQVANDVSCGLV